MRFQKAIPSEPTEESVSRVTDPIEFDPFREGSFQGNAFSS